MEYYEAADKGKAKMKMSHKDIINTKKKQQLPSSGRIVAKSTPGGGGSSSSGRSTKKTNSGGSNSVATAAAAATAVIHSLNSTRSIGRPDSFSPSSRSSSATSLFSPHHQGGGGGGAGGGGTTANNNNTNQKVGGYQGMYRSAAAAHRHRQIHIPPIGSPGLLMVPTVANTSSITPPIATAADREKWFVKVATTANNNNNGKKEDDVVIMEEYILPSTVFRQSMIAGGYTYNAAPPSPPSSSSAQQRLQQPPPPKQQQQQVVVIERGSSTERNVGDMFDSDAGGLYLHFPELIPLSLWHRRFGDDDQDMLDEEDWRNDEFGSGVNTTTATTSNNTATTQNKVKNENGNQGEGVGESTTSTTTTTSRGPKGARSSYIFFTNDQRPLMMKQFPGMRFTEQGIIMGERWRALTPEEKRPYENLAAEDKERHAREMKEYIAIVKKEVREEKQQQQQQQLNGKREEDGGWEEDGENNSPSKLSLAKKERRDDSNGAGMKRVGNGRSSSSSGKNKPEDRGQRLVDAMILGLCKMLGEKVNREEVMTEDGDEPKPVDSSEEVKSNEVEDAGTTSATTAAATDDSTTAIDADANPENNAPTRPRRVSPPDLTELPQFTPHPSHPRTRPRPRPYAPLSFLDMIPISLTSTYPPSYVVKRRAYAQAVKDREHAIIEAQEAKDDYDDAQEKYVAHVEAWDRMLEYQKVQIAKREAEAKREREEEIFKQLEDGVGTIIHRPSTPPPEDPMDCMPPRPEPPGPARIVSIPDIPTPPSPPPVVEMDETEVVEVDGNVEIMNEDAKSSSSSSSVIVPMRVPKVNKKLIQHLDPACFLPTMSGRYLGLLSNHISDPQFCGILAPGIAGTTYGGGTGLATSYTGGGRGAIGLVSGPSRGGSMWQTPAGVGSGKNSNTTSVEKKPLVKEKSVIPLEVPSSTVVAAPTLSRSSSADDRRSPAPCDDAPLSSPPPTLTTSAEKRPCPTPSDASIGVVVTSREKEKKNKKQKRATCLLTTGDRNTTATEIASGMAGPEFPAGWVIKTYRRSGGETIGKTDRFWFSPGRNIRFRAKKHAMAFVEILNEEDVGGDEDKAAEIYRTRGLHF
ncbi:hypothetical protein ACHAXH_008671 [Discostella pseudostelligera]